MLDSDTIIPLRKRERRTREGNGLWVREKYNRKKKCIIGRKEGTKYKNALHPYLHRFKLILQERQHNYYGCFSSIQLCLALTCKFTEVVNYITLVNLET